MADNSYPIEIKPSAKAGWYTPAEARPVYGKYGRDGVTYHWWNTRDKIRDSDHDNIVNMMNNNAAAGRAPTVNYVASNGKLTLLINPDNVAWCSNNGNATTISVECSPHFTDALYKKLGWLHDQLEQRYGKTLAIYGHRDWVDTACPGDMDLGRIRHEANAWKTEREAPVAIPIPVTQPTRINLSFNDVPDVAVKITKQTNLWDLSFDSYANARSIKPLAAGESFTVSAIVEHPLGSKYYVTPYSHSKGIYNGVNVKDTDYPDPTKLGVPILPPVVVPVPVPPVEEPEPPVVVDPLKGIEERLSIIEAILKSVTDFLSSVFSGFKK